MRRPLLTTLIVAAGLLGTVGAAPASADRVIETYDLEYTGEATYDRVDVWDGDDDRTTWDFGAKFTWTATADGVQFVDGRLAGAQPTDVTVQVQSADSNFLHVWPSGSETGSCTGSTATPPGGGVLGDGVIVNGTRTLMWDPVDEVELPMTCSGALAGGDLALVLGNGSSMEATWQVPRAAQSAGQVIQLVSGPGTGECPLRTPATASCTWEWTGQIKMTRTARRTVKDQKPAPPAPPLPPTPPAGSGNPVDVAIQAINEELEKQKASDDQLVKNATDAIQEWLDNERIADDISRVFQRETSKARVQLRCPSGCSGSVKAYGASGPKSKGSGRPLASGTFRSGARARAAASGGRRVTAELRFGRAARKKLRRHRYVALRFTLKVAGVPKPVRSTVVVRVRRR